MFFNLELDSNPGTLACSRKWATCYLASNVNSPVVTDRAIIHVNDKFFWLNPWHWHHNNSDKDTSADGTRTHYQFPKCKVDSSNLVEDVVSGCFPCEQTGVLHSLCTTISGADKYSDAIPPLHKLSAMWFTKCGACHLPCEIPAAGISQALPGLQHSIMQRVNVKRSLTWMWKSWCLKASPFSPLGGEKWLQQQRGCWSQSKAGVWRRWVCVMFTFLSTFRCFFSVKLPSLRFVPLALQPCVEFHQSSTGCRGEPLERAEAKQDFIVVPKFVVHLPNHGTGHCGGLVDPLPRLTVLSDYFWRAFVISSCWPRVDSLPAKMAQNQPWFMNHAALRAATLGDAPHANRFLLPGNLTGSVQPSLPPKPLFSFLSGTTMPTLFSHFSLSALYMALYWAT